MFYITEGIKSVNVSSFKYEVKMQSRNYPFLFSCMKDSRNFMRAEQSDKVSQAFLQPQTES